MFLLEVELEEAWLTDAGLASLVTGLPLADEVPPPAEVLLSTLTHQQATTVRKRLDNYNETLKKRNRQPIRDVRDIFTEVGHKQMHFILNAKQMCNTDVEIFYEIV